MVGRRAASLALGKITPTAFLNSGANKKDVRCWSRLIEKLLFSPTPILP